ERTVLENRPGVEGAGHGSRIMRPVPTAAQREFRRRTCYTSPVIAPSPPPPAGTLEAWAWEFLASDDIDRKFQLAAPPRDELESDAPSRRDVRPARPRELAAARAKAKTPGPEALRTPARRARIVHTFLHHELQAAELMCWAILAYPRAPVTF